MFESLSLLSNFGSEAMPWKRHLADISEEFARCGSLSEHGQAAAAA